MAGNFGTSKSLVGRYCSVIDCLRVPADEFRGDTQAIVVVQVLVAE